MFFEAASFSLVRDHGVHHLSRHRVREERDADVADAVVAARTWVAPALVEGVGVGVCLGRLTPEDAVAVLRSGLACLAR